MSSPNPASPSRAGTVGAGQAFERLLEVAEEYTDPRIAQMIDVLPAAIYVTDAKGKITYFNQACVDFSGRVPLLGSDHWCVSWKLFYPDGRPMPHAECPMAIALNEGRAVRGTEAIAERPDGTRIWFEPYPTPLFDDRGALVGGINMLVDITERKEVEEQRAVEAAALATLNRLSSKLWQLRDLRSGLDEILSATMELVGADFGNVQIFDPARNVLEIAAHRGFGREFLDFFREVSTEDSSACGRALRTRTLTIIDDVEEDAAYEPLRPVARSTGFRAVLSAPLLGRGGSPLGMISTHFRASGRPSEYELNLLDLYARQASDFIERCSGDEERNKVEAALRLAARQQRAVTQIGEYSLSCSLQDTFDFATAAIAETLDVEYCKVLELLPGGEHVLLRSGVGWEPGLVGTATVDTGMNSQAGYTLSSDVPVVVRDLRQEDRFNGPPLLTRHGVISGMSCIIRQPNGLAWGVLGTHAKRAVEFTEDDVNFLTAVASVLGSAVQHHRALQAVRKSEGRYKSLLSLLPAAVYTCDAAGRITYYNERAAELWGRSPKIGPEIGAETGDSNLLYCGSVELFLPDGTHLPHDQCPMATALREGRSFRGEEVNIRRPDGSLVPVIVNIDPIRNDFGEIEGAINAFHDISGIRQAEQALREAHQELHSELADSMLLQRLSAAMIQQEDIESIYTQIIDAAATLMRADCASMQILYPERGELRLLASRGFTAEAASFWEWVRADSGCSCGEAFRTGKRSLVPDIERCEFMAGTPDRDAYLQAGILAVQSTPLVSRSGNMIGMISTHWKSTHAPSERALRAFDILARQAADLLERTRTEEALRDADRRKDEFLAMLSHELRNPLAPILGATQVLRLNEPGGGESLVQKQAREIIERQVAQLTRLVNDLLEVSRVITGRVRLQLQEVDLRTVIDTALETTRPLFERRKIRVITDLDAAAAQLRADPVRLQQVFANLLNNAAKYTDEGGLVAVSVTRSRDAFVIRVRDNGAGIAPDLLPRIFDLFSQAEQTMDRSEGGLGIGLSLVKHLVALHGGRVEGRSDGLGLGSEFRVELPGGAALPTPSKAPATRELPVVERSFRILVVDDNVDSCTMLTALLRHAGHSVREAHDGQAALQSALMWLPDIILLDIGLPLLSGYEVARRLRQEALTAKVRLVALTGYGQEEDIKAAAEAGFDAHFTKPLDFEAFMERISVWSGAS